MIDNSVNETGQMIDSLPENRPTAVGVADIEPGLVRQCLADSVGALEQARELTLHLSANYRGANVAEGHQGLSALALELSALASIVATLDRAGIHLSAVVDGMTVPEHIDALGSVIGSLVAAQESEDWLTVADVLEYDLEPAIGHWIRLLGLLAVYRNASTAFLEA
jgi:hypothetical protein